MTTCESVIHMSKRKILVIGATERLRRRLISLLGDLPGVNVSKRNDLVDIESYFSEHRFDAILIEAAPNFELDISRLHLLVPSMPILAYDDSPDYAQTRSAFQSGALDVLKIRSSTADEICDSLERALSPLNQMQMAENQHQARNLKNVARRGQYFVRQLMDGTPPTFYMNGNRATLLRANVLCTQQKQNILWQYEAASEWIQEFGTANTFIFESSGSELRLGAIVEQDYVNTASFKRMLASRLERFYERMSKMNCVCVATHCSSDYLSLSVLHHLDNLADLVFYMDECQTILDSTNRFNASFPAQLYSEFCSAVAVRDVSTAVVCIDRAVLKLRNDLPSPNFARSKLGRFIWEFASVIGSRSDQDVLTRLDDSHITFIRDTIVNLIRSTLSAASSTPSASPLDELIRRIEANPGIPINIDQAAEEINFSRSHFCRLFRQQTGLSFTAFLTQKRIAMACDLLKKTGMRIDEISDIVGISNTWYFKKLFQKEIGIPVEDWIVQNRDFDLLPPPQS